MGYRAMGRVGRDYKGRRDRRNIDKWFCGSYRDYIPDHYELGYQICSYAYARYDENVWDRVGVVRFAQPLHAGHHPHRARKILRHERP